MPTPPAPVDTSRLSAPTRDGATPSARGRSGGGVDVTASELVALASEARRASLDANRRVTSPRSGGYHSRRRGRGLDFDEHRHYQPGDDVRTIDWRVTARRGTSANQVYTKVFREERERPILLAVDLRRHMYFGSRVAFKSVTACRTAAFLGWVAAEQGDRVGTLVLDDSGLRALRPKGGRRGVLASIRLLVERHRPDQARAASAETSKLSTLVEGAAKMAVPGALVVVISDFTGLDDYARQLIGRLRHHHEVIGCFIYDALEAEPPPPGLYPVSDGTRTRKIDLRNPEARRHWMALFDERSNGLSELFVGLRLHLLRLGTHQGLTDSLALLLQRRALRLGR